MFFFHVERLQVDDGDTVADRVQGKSFSIVPLVSPTSKAGQALLDSSEMAVLSVVAGSDVSVLYVARSSVGKFEEFAGSVLKPWREISDEIVRDPAVLVFWPGGKQAILLGLDSADDASDFKALLFDLVEAVRTDDPADSIRRVSRMRNARVALQENRGAIGEILKVLAKLVLVG